MNWKSSMVRFGLVGLAVLALVAVVVKPAISAAFTKSVYPPNRVSSDRIQGWADLNLDGNGTYGSWNYIKIERKRWWGGEFVAGWWANNNGWNSITATLPSGTWEYRTTVDSYNDVAGSYGSGVNVGQVGTSSNGTAINRYRTTWSSGWTTHRR